MDDSAHFCYNGQLLGHGGWVTGISTPLDCSDVVYTASRDKSVMRWALEPDSVSDSYGHAERRMEGHSGFVQDVTVSSDGQFGLSASWDATLRLWDLSTGSTTRKFVGHDKDALTCAFSADNRQIVSGSRDAKMKLWNTLGECKYTIADGHSDWVSCVRFSPNPQTPLLVSASWDKTAKVWSLGDMQLQEELSGHTANLNTVALSPDGSLCATGGRDGSAKLWDLQKGESLYDLDGSDVIHELVFSPNRYWLCAAAGSAIRIWDLESKSVVAELIPELPKMGPKATQPECVSLAWSADGATLFSGYTDSTVRVWGVRS